MELPFEDKSPRTLFDEAVVDLRRDVPPPPKCITIGENTEYTPPRPYVFGTYGNISLIKGEEKVRKSFAKSLLVACTLGGKANNYSERIRGHLEDRWVVEVDTEQDPYYVRLNTSRIIKMCGAIPPNYLSLQLRSYNPKQRMEVLKYLFEQSPIKGKLGLVFIDGYVDLIHDFNSLSESQQLTQQLMTWSTEAHCHISGILHLNPGTTKGRGHIGTILQQKCETIAIVTKNEETSTMTCQRGRGANWEPVTFRIDRDFCPVDTDLDKSPY